MNTPTTTILTWIARHSEVLDNPVATDADKNAAAFAIDKNFRELEERALAGDELAAGFLMLMVSLVDIAEVSGTIH
jgi:hypothetical protein